MSSIEEHIVSNYLNSKKSLEQHTKDLDYDIFVTLEKEKDHSIEGFLRGRLELEISMTRKSLELQEELRNHFLEIVQRIL